MRGGQLLQAGRDTLGGARHRLAMLQARLIALDPQRVVERGYSVVQTLAGELLTDPRQLSRGQQVQLTMARGTAEVELAEVRLRP